MPSPDPAGVLEAINQAWQHAPPEGIATLLAQHFTDDAVFVAPNLARVARGRDAVAASYADFARNANVLEVHIDPAQVDFDGDVAIATMPWSIRYEFDQRRTSERGYDTYVFRRQGDRWRVCWRSMVPLSAQTEPV
jgi:uncharacterized protein (TIGR02246 family)